MCDYCLVGEQCSIVNTCSSGPGGVLVFRLTGEIFYGDGF